MNPENSQSLPSPVIELEFSPAILDVRPALPATGKISVLGAGSDEEAISRFEKEYESSPNTMRAYKKECVRFCLWLKMVAGKNLCELTRADVDDFFDFAANPPPSWVSDQPTSRKKGNWKPFKAGLHGRSMHYMKTVISGMFGYLVDAGYLDSNPFALVRKRFREEDSLRQRRHALDEDAIDYVKSAIEKMPEENEKQKIKKSRYRLIFTLYLHTGARCSEIVGASTQDLVFDRGRTWLKVKGKGGKTGYLPLTKKIMGMLIEHRKLMGCPDTFSGTSPAPLVSKLRDGGSAITDNMVYRIIKSVFVMSANQAMEEGDSFSEAVLRKASTHWLRHTGVARVVDETEDLRLAQRFGRHERITTTAGYARKDEDDFHDKLTDVAEKW
jgi:integrase